MISKKLKNSVILLSLICTSAKISSQPLKLPWGGQIDIEATAVHYAAIRVIPGALLLTDGMYQMADGAYNTVKRGNSILKRTRNFLKIFYGAALSAVGLHSLDIVRLALAKNGTLNIQTGANLQTIFTLLSYSKDPAMNV